MKLIPLNIFQTWHTKHLEPEMEQAVNQLKLDNPEFKHYLYDYEQCRKFIAKYFDYNVLAAFDGLIPGAYKADLWRYCVLYIHGGIYLDIKFVSENRFKLLHLTDKEYFILDKPNPNPKMGLSTWIPGKNGIYNGLMVCKPKNHIPEYVSTTNAITLIKGNHENVLEIESNLSLISKFLIKI